MSKLAVDYYCCVKIHSRSDKKFKILLPRYALTKVDLHQEVNAVENALRGNYYRGPSRLSADPFRIRYIYMPCVGRGRVHRKSYETEYARCALYMLIKIVLGQGRKCIQYSDK